MNKSHKKAHKSNYEHYKVSSSSRSNNKNNREPIIKVGFSYNATDVTPAAFQPNRTINTAGTLGYGTFHLALSMSPLLVKIFSLLGWVGWGG